MSKASVRECGSCTLCCKVYDIPPMQSPAGGWCKACKPGQGCGIWQERPQFCRDFHCAWILDMNFGPEWRPDKAKFVMNWEQQGRQLSIVVDPGSPKAWQAEPYYSAFRRMAALALAEQKCLMVFTGNRKLLILPDQEVEIGKRSETVDFAIHTRQTPAGLRYEVEVSPAEA